MQLSICPFCRDTSSIEENRDFADATGITQFCLGCRKDLSSQPHNDLSRLNRSFIDKLPYGIIIINDDDKIIHYNRTESDLTGFDPNEIQGKDFFKDVAPCTAVKEFQGKLTELRQRSLAGQENFSYTFNHMNFFSRVNIILTYDPNTGNAVITVKVIAEEDDYGEQLIDIDEF